MDDLRVNQEVVIPATELEWRFDPAGGPGGQHANRSSTRVELRYDIAESAAFDDALRERVIDQLGSEAPHGVLTIRVGESRSQWRNRQIARRRLVDKLRRAMRPPAPPRRQTRRTRASQERRLADKRARSETKQLRRRPEID
ncbi:MAG: alternative ribosome rescue aminoacyl-tRNA hydrolase ArfB [Acidimicrobiia bacterium]|nr:alternative ribosome rescue aminoacyl-tRNA hydrolase ArfB [Acidimicrobiia bacterium]